MPDTTYDQVNRCGNCGWRSSRSRSSSVPPPTSPRRTSSQNELRLHRRALLGSARLGVLPGDEGVDVGLLPAPRRAGHRRELAEASRANTVFDIWKMSRHSYGMPRIRNELRLGRHEGCSRTTLARLMRICGAVGIHYRRRGGCTRPGDGDPQRRSGEPGLRPRRPDRLWCMG